MGTGLPFPLEVVLLLLGLPLAFAWLFVLAGLVSLSMRHPLKKLRRLFESLPTSPEA